MNPGNRHMLDDERQLAHDVYKRSSQPLEVSVIMPVRNEERFIERAIASVVNAGQQVLNYEIIVVDGMSDDRTRDIAERLGASLPNLKVIDNPEQIVPFAMNRGLDVAQGEIVIRLDGHAEMTPTFMSACLAELEKRPECACVGGPIENVGVDDMGMIVSAAMRSPFGVGNARFRTGGTDGYVDTLAFGAYRKSDIVAVGKFDTDLVRNQDDELNFRLIRAGRKIWFSTAIRARYYVRSSLGKLARQYFQYGYWKVFVNRKHSMITSRRQLAPPLLLVLLSLLLLGSFVSHEMTLLLLAVLVTYLAGATYFAWRVADEARHVLGIVTAFCVLHGSYGLGYLAGVYDFFILRRSPSARRTELSR